MLIWSFSFLLIKLAVVEIPAETLVFYRVALGACVLLPVALLSKEKWPPFGPQWGVLLMVATCGNVLPFYLIHLGEYTVSSGLAAVLMGIMPLVTATMGHFVLKEYIGPRRIFGISLGFGGLITLFGWDSLSGLGESFGQFLIAAGALSYAITTITVRKVNQPLNLGSAALTLLIASVLGLLMMLLTGEQWVMPSTPKVWISTLLLGFASTGLATVLYYALLQRMQATSFSQINFLIPLLGYFWGVWLMGEPVRVSALVALVCISIGVFFVVRPRHRVKPED